MIENMHKLLKRQIRKYCPSEKIPKEWENFLAAVNEAYHSSDDDRNMLEHSIELSSTELFESNLEIKKTYFNLKKAHDELQQAQQQLFQSKKMASIGQLAAGVAHEINNPIGYINSNIDIMRDYIKNYNMLLSMYHKVKDHVKNNDLSGAKTAIQELEDIKEKKNIDYMIEDCKMLLEESATGIERIKKIVKDLNIFARPKEKVQEDISLNVTLDSVLNIVNSELKYKAEVRKEYGDIPPIQGDENKLGQVFLNLLINAAQAMEESGRITIRTYVEKGRVCVQIADTGKGIEQSKINNIFDPFFTTKPVGKGTGLGLSVSYDIVQKHDGDIRVESKVGEGTTFTLTFPKSKKSKRTKASTDSKPAKNLA